MGDSYDVFSNLNELVDNNILGKLQKQIPSIEETSHFDELECDIEAELRSSRSSLSAEKRTRILANAAKQDTTKPTKQKEPKSSETVQEPKVAATGRTTRASRRKRILEAAVDALLKEEAPTTTAVTDPTKASLPKGGRRRRKGKMKPAADSAATAIDVTAETAQSIGDTIARPHAEPSMLNMIRPRNDNSIGRNHRNVMRARRNYIAEKAARSTNVDYVDLVSSPMPRVEGMISLDSDDESSAPKEPNKKTATNNATTLNAISLDLSFDEDNPEMSIKVIWKGEPEVFQLRKYQKFAHICQQLAKRENVSIEDVALNLNNKIITPNDTPDGIDYKIFQFIHGRVLTKKYDTPAEKTNKRAANEIVLKIQSDRWKRPLIVKLLKTDKFKILYIKCAEELNVAYEQLRLSFDGEHLEYNATPAELELDGGEAIDLYFRN